jgi:hypothetical protein
MKDLFHAMPGPVKKLKEKADSEMRKKARVEWWAKNGPVSNPGTFRKLTQSPKP